MAWKFESGIPIYMQISEQITMDIISGVYPAGSRLPSVREFAVMASVNPNTMQKALTELEAMGLITTQRSAGRYVTTDENTIKAAGYKKLKEITADYMEKLSSLGYSKEDAVDIIQNSQEVYLK